MKLIVQILTLFMITNAYAASENSYSQQILSLHNQFRAKHHAPALIWDDNLANFAKQHASQCIFRHSHSGYGENIAAGYPTISKAINAWYNEGKNYSYFWPGFSYQTGHFTQIVWRSSRKIGCAWVPCNGQNGTPGHFLVCEYSPHGNIASRNYFKNNVLHI